MLGFKSKEKVYKECSSCGSDCLFKDDDFRKWMEEQEGCPMGSCEGVVRVVDQMKEEVYFHMCEKHEDIYEKFFLSKNHKPRRKKQITLNPFNKHPSHKHPSQRHPKPNHHRSLLKSR